MIDGRQFCIKGLTEAKRDTVRLRVLSNGGHVSALMTPASEVLIVDDATPNAVVEKAMDNGMEVWTVDDLEQNAQALFSPPAVTLPATREEALALIAQLQEKFDIEHGDDMYTSAIAAIESRWEAQVGEIVRQAMGVAIKASGRKFLIVDANALLDRKPYDVQVTDLPNGTVRYQLKGIN